LANATVDDDDLRDLADRRAKAVRDALLAKSVPAERLFLLPVKLGKADGKSDGKAETAAVGKISGVVFSLK
jgi:outer membrane protein OmpA-like peptidoglycan-associated protein